MAPNMILINGYTDYYITDTGEVYSHKGKVLKKLKTRYDRDGYGIITLCDYGIPKDFRIHRLVAQHYIPNPLNLPLVCHKDDNPSNNAVSNLFWGTPKDNNNDMILKGRKVQTRGSDCVHSKLTNDDVLYIRKVNILPGTISQLAKQYNVHYTTIFAIVKGTKWKHLT